MFREQRGKWHWVLREPGILDAWFDNYPAIATNNTVKKNPVRTVFRYDDYFIKLDTPESLLHQVRGRLRPKAEQEFKTALALEHSAVPIVEHLGWGHCGSTSMLITRAFPNAVSVMDYWMNSFVYGNDNCATFLVAFGRFLQKVFSSGCYHPDLHTGNILYDPINNQFALVDLYGIKPGHKPLAVHKKLKMFGIITGLRAGLSDAEAIAFIASIKLQLNNETAEELWRQLLDIELLRIQSVWPKRKKQIIAEYDKFMIRRNDASGKYLFRNKQNRKPYISPELPLNTTALNLYPMTLPVEKAEQLWVDAFLNNFLGIKQNMPLVWYQPNNSADSILYFPEPHNSLPKQETPSI